MVLFRKAINGGTQVVHKFDNGYGASVIRHSFSYGNDRGLFELAVLKFIPDTDDFDLDYDTPITDDVLGSLTEHLLEKSKHVLAYEIDNELVTILSENFIDENLTIIGEDFL